MKMQVLIKHFSMSYLRKGRHGKGLGLNRTEEQRTDREEVSMSRIVKVTMARRTGEQAEDSDYFGDRHSHLLADMEGLKRTPSIMDGVAVFYSSSLDDCFEDAHEFMGRKKRRLCSVSQFDMKW